ncbi:MAG: MerC domain-containing protein [Betaproteobacteria bacterium]|nr:MerC domain-containing protein [Betaproteobacteria bacterium]
MKNFQIFTDKTAIGLSCLCTIHCLSFPLLVVLLPGLAALQLNDEAFHTWMVIAVVPTSTFALTISCRQHKRYHLLILGLLGVTCLILAVALSEMFLSEVWEKMLTSIGAGLIAYGHYRNYRLCQHQGDCACPEYRDDFSK